MSDITLDSLIESISMQDEVNQDMTKQASDATTELEQALSNDNVGENNTMTKSAHEVAGQSIADAILAGLQKQASENTVAAETQTMVNQDTAKIKETPVAGKTVSEVAQALMARAAAEGKTEKPCQVDAEVKAEGGAQTEGRAPIDSQLDKQAAEALSALIADGVDFAEAAELVKEAQANLTADMEKAAAVSHLMDNGIDFAAAVELVKQASEVADAGEYSDLEKKAALDQLMGEGHSFADALAAINEVISGQ